METEKKSCCLRRWWLASLTFSLQTRYQGVFLWISSSLLFLLCCLLLLFVSVSFICLLRCLLNHILSPPARKMVSSQSERELEDVYLRFRVGETVHMKRLVQTKQENTLNLSLFHQLRLQRALLVSCSLKSFCERRILFPVSWFESFQHCFREPASSLCGA